MKKQGKNYILSEDELKELLVKASINKVNPHDKLENMIYNLLDDSEEDIDDLVARIMTKAPPKRKPSSNSGWSSGGSSTFSGCRSFSRC